MRGIFALAVLAIAELVSNIALAREPDLIGPATVIDGDKIEISGQRIRLFGIDAPEISQNCLDEAGASYRCGQVAAGQLEALIAARPVRCIEVTRPGWGRVVAKCRVEDVGIGRWMVRHGFALDFVKYSKGFYADEQEKAQDERLGLHAGRFTPPSEFRDCRRGGGSVEKCSQVVEAQ